jgi:hypothetical protein
VGSKEGGRGRGGEMTQTLYAHIKKKSLILFKMVEDPIEFLSAWLSVNIY